MSEAFRENTTKEVGGGGRMEIVRLGLSWIYPPT